jgi:hypothetical protein
MNEIQTKNYIYIEREADIRRMDKEKLGVMKFVTLRKWWQPKSRCQIKKHLKPKIDWGYKKITILKIAATQRKMIFRTF